MVTEKINFIYGPVPSRRLGRSLGIDMVPHKVCTYDCIYCQLGRTTNRTLQRSSYYPAEEIVRQIREVFKGEVCADHVTLSGSGEPTLHMDMERIISEIKGMTDIPVAVITNSSLLSSEKVVQELKEADLILPSLDAGSAEMFQHVNRPCPDIRFERIVQGLRDLRNAFDKQIWLEVMVVNGITSFDSEIEKMVEIVSSLCADKIQLNTVTRPPSRGFACPVRIERMEAIAKMFGPGAETVASYTGERDVKWVGVNDEKIWDLLQRRPCSIDDIAEGLAIHRNEALKHIGVLESRDLIDFKKIEGKVFYSAKGRVCSDN